LKNSPKKKTNQKFKKKHFFQNFLFKKQQKFNVEKKLYELQKASKKVWCAYVV
jgi:hypothetical protein